MTLEHDAAVISGVVGYTREPDGSVAIVVMAFLMDKLRILE